MATRANLRPERTRADTTKGAQVALVRPWHYLKPSRHAGYPKQQIALHVGYERVQRRAQHTVADDGLTRWTARSWSGGPDQEQEGAEGTGTDAQSFWAWLARVRLRKACCWLWQLGAAHGLTLLGFWDCLTAGEWILSRGDNAANLENGEDAGGSFAGLCIVEDPPTIILVQQPHRSGTVRFVDCRNLGVGAWSDLGIHRGDVGGLAAWLQQWSRTVERLNLGGLRQTAAAQAWHGWRYNYLEDGVLVHGNDEASRLERDSIHPGRAEAYRLGVVGGPVAHYDASAYYPACAVSGPLPCRLRWLGDCSIGRLTDATDRGWLAIAECRIRCTEPMFPRRAAERTDWPVGEWTVTLPGPEIARALATGCLLSVGRVALYEGGLPLNGFVHALWLSRCRAEEGGRLAERQCIKLILNSLIGRLCARAKSWIDAPEPLPLGPWRTWYGSAGEGRKRIRYRSVGWHVQRLEEGGETAESTPALASWIYSIGRMRLWDWMECAGRENVYYVDSDSLHTSTAGGDALRAAGMVAPDTLGALRLQGVYPTLRIGGIRDYATPGRTVRAGVATDPDRFLDGVDAWWRESTVREAIDEWHQPEATARLVAVPINRAYRHGVVDAQGRVSPHVVSE